jgi:hypothetical protein
LVGRGSQAGYSGILSTFLRCCSRQPLSTTPPHSQGPGTSFRGQRLASGCSLQSSAS